MTRTLAREVLGLFWSGWRLVLLAALLTLALGETYMRLPFLLPRLEYMPDRELEARLMPGQRGYLWLANMSMRTPPISVNREGHRGGEDDWRRPVILVVGDSEWFGAGVEDEEVWPRVLERRLNTPARAHPVHVVNASQPGFGPYHQAVVLDRELTRHHVEAVIVRVSIAQRNFRPVAEANRDAWVAAAERRAALRRWTLFLPFLANKLEAQLPSIRTALIPVPLRRQGRSGEELSERVGRAMAAEASPWWQRMSEDAEAAQTPLLFVLHEPIPSSSTGPLEDALRSLAASHPHTHIVDLGPAIFGLDPSAPVDELRRTLRTRLTLGRDPHANPLQHRLIAQALDDALRSLEIPATR